MPLFTAENAAEMGKRGALARWSEPEKPANDSPVTEPIAEPTLDFAQQRLVRVRMQLDRLDAMAAESCDTKQLKELADATSRLQEQERQLAGRPLPGTLKPSSKPTQSRRTVSPVGVDTTIPSGPEQSSDPK